MIRIVVFVVTTVCLLTFSSCERFTQKKAANSHAGETAAEHAAHSHEGETAEEHAAHADEHHAGETAEEHAALSHEGEHHAGDGQAGEGGGEAGK